MFFSNFLINRKSLSPQEQVEMTPLVAAETGRAEQNKRHPPVAVKYSSATYDCLFFVRALN